MKLESPVSIGVEIEMCPGKAQDDLCDGGIFCPEGWDRGEDGGGIELRFDGPANSLDEAFELLDAAKEWMDKYEIRRFTNSGTHIHLGIPELIKEHLGLRGDPVKVVDTDQGGWLNCIQVLDTSYAVFWAYFLSRQRLLQATTTSTRRRSNWAADYFDTSGRGDHTFLATRKTPLLDIHKHFLSRVRAPGDTYYMCAPFRKNLPTFEFRIWQGTNNISAVKGYLCLLLNMVTHAAKVCPNNPTPKELAEALIVHPATYSLADFKQEIRDANFFSEELIEWFDLTLKNRGRPTDFNYDERRTPEKAKKETRRAKGESLSRYLVGAPA